MFLKPRLAHTDSLLLPQFSAAIVRLKANDGLESVPSARGLRTTPHCLE